MLPLVIWGARASLAIGLIATALTVVLGSADRLARRALPRFLGRALMHVTDWFIALPSLPLAISLAAVIGQGPTSITIAIVVTSWTPTARLVRAQTLAVEARPFVERAKALGAGHYPDHAAARAAQCRAADPGVEHADGGERDPVRDDA